MLEFLLGASDEVGATPPAIPTTGTPGYPQDEAEGVKGTPWTADKYEMLHGSLRALITALGGTFGANTTALRDALMARVGAVRSVKGSYYPYTAEYVRAKIAAVSSDVYQDLAALVVTVGSVVGNRFSESPLLGVLAASVNAKLTQPGLGVGWGATELTTEQKDDANNHNLQVFMDPLQGVVKSTKGAKFAGDVDADTGYKFVVNEDGDVQGDGTAAFASGTFAGPVQLNSLVIPDTGEGHRVGWTSFTGLNIISGAWSDALNVTVAGMTGIGSRVLVTVLNCTGGAPVISEIVVRDESFGVRVQNVGSTTCTQVAFTWLVIDTPSP